MSANVTNFRHHPSPPPPGAATLERLFAPGGKSCSATTDEVMDRIVSTSSMIMFPSMGFFSSFLGGSDVTLLSDSYIFAFFLFQMLLILCSAGLALCLALTSEFSRDNEQSICNLSVIASISYVFLVSTFGLLSLVMHFIPFSSSVDHVAGILLCLLFLAFHARVIIWIAAMNKFDEPEVVHVRVVSTALVIAFVTYVVGLGLQCIATMVTDISMFWSAATQVPMIMMLAQKHGRGRLFL